VVDEYYMMSTMLSMSRSPQSLRRECDEDDDLETPLYIPDGEGFIKGEHDEDNDFQTQEHAPDCENSNSFSTPPRNRAANFKTESSPVSLASTKRASSPARSSTGSLSDAGTSTPVGLRPSPTTAFTALNGIVQPPKKRVKLTFAEKEEQKILKAVRDQEKAEERAQRELEKKAKEEDKARRDAEKEAERKRKEAEREEKRLVKEAERAEKEEKRLIKEAERAEKDREKKAKEDEKRRKEEEKQRIEEEKRKKERSQPTLNAFFKKPATAPNDGGLRKSPSPAPRAAIQSSSVSIAKSPCKLDSVPEYQKRFPPFFVQNNVKVAPFTQFGRDERALNALEDVIDSYIHGQRSPEKRQPFDPVRLFNLLHFNVKPRGRKITPVREIMSQILGNSKRPIDLTTDSQNIQIKNTRNLLRKVPYKILSFAEDVRPPYKGTYTSHPISGMRRMARNPTRRDLPHVNYDYDSEAEWEDDDGEDVESDCNDDEEIGDGGEDLEEFLDDAEAESLNARKIVMQGDLESKCSGLCWEDQKRRGPNVKMYRYLMEIITGESLPRLYKVQALKLIQMVLKSEHQLTRLQPTTGTHPHPLA
jgi:chromatin assembly factor 1 subunit A